MFEQCPRAVKIWDETNKQLEEKYNIKIPISFDEALNPGRNPDPVGQILDAAVAITVHQIWLDYCDYMHAAAYTFPLHN